METFDGFKRSMSDRIMRMDVVSVGKGNMYRFVVSLCVVFGVLAGCSTDKTNPAGSALVDRNPGDVVTVPAIEMRAGQSFQELVLPIVLGQREEVLVGQMNGFRFKSLFRFRVPVDSLAQVVGESARDLVATQVQAVLSLRETRLFDQAQVSFLRPTDSWGELRTFVDTLSLIERPVNGTLMTGASTQVLADTTLIATFPVTHFRSLRTGNPPVVNFEFMVSPQGSQDFLYDFVSREGQTLASLGRHPKLALTYQVGAVVDTFWVEPTADTYLAERVDGGPARDNIIVSKGTFYSSILDFEMPDNFPRGATVNSAQLELDLDLDRSYFTAFPFELYHVEFRTSAQDTVYTLYNTQNEINPNATVNFVFNQSLIQAWLSGAQVNQGMALRAVGSPVDFTWVVIENARLKLIYSNPPEL